MRLPYRIFTWCDRSLNSCGAPIRRAIEFSYHLVFPRSLPRFDRDQASRSRDWLALAFVVSVTCVALFTSSGLAQSDVPLNVAEGVDALTAGVDPSQVVDTNSAALPSREESLNLWSLILRGGWLMLPIFLMSVFVIGIAIERFLGLREHKILPRDFVDELGHLAAGNGFDPQEAYRICQEFPSSASIVVRSMLLKVGRPLSEVEHTVSEASDREASRLYGNVRWLNLIAVVAPLVGLFGTVWGMILAFFQTSLLTAGQNKSVVLADGIYGALVTTLGGLAVAIPAAVFSHYFEGRIQKLFFQIDELILNLMPQIEQYEGRLRMSQAELGGGAASQPSTTTPPMQQPPRTPSAQPQQQQ